MSFFNDITEEGFETQGDVLGGGGALESDVYDAVVKIAYAGTSKGGAKSVTLILDINGNEHRFTEYVTSGTAKGGKNTYERNGKTFALPGYELITDLLMIATGKGLRAQTIETKEVKQYDPAQRKEVNSPAPVLMDLLNKPIKVAIYKSTEDKTTEASDGSRVPNGETFERANIAKFFHPVKHVTLQEALEANKAGTAPEPKFMEMWLKRNKGKTRDNTKKDGAVKNRPSSASDASKPAASLFD